MIGRLKGTLVERQSDGSCILDVGGVGYEVFVPLSSYARLPRAPEAAVLFVHTHVREDALVLYGFPSQEDRAAFRSLLGVASIGPKLALAILSQLDASSLALAVSRGDKTAFKGIAGVGKKTVERVLIDLRDKLTLPIGTAPSERPAPAVVGPLATVVSALVHMGYKQSEAELAVGKVAAQAEGKTPEALLRAALSALA